VRLEDPTITVDAAGVSDGAWVLLDVANTSLAGEIRAFTWQANVTDSVPTGASVLWCTSLLVRPFSFLPPFSLQESSHLRLWWLGSVTPRGSRRRC